MEPMLKQLKLYGTNVHITSVEPVGATWVCPPPTHRGEEMLRAAHKMQINDSDPTNTEAAAAP